MQTIITISTVMIIILSIASVTFAQDKSPIRSQEGRTKITLTIEGKNYPAILYANMTARDLISRLPLTLSLNRGGRDYCGDISPLQYDRHQVQQGYRNGELAYWVPGQDFVIFIEKEETGASVDGVVVIGEMSDKLQSLFNLGNSIKVHISMAE